MQAWEERLMVKQEGIKEGEKIMEEMVFQIGPIRPPSEANSLLLRVTVNCPWNRCKFCMLYKKYDFHIYEQINQGLSTTINNGLKYVRGEYLLWPDADDWFDDDIKFISDKTEYHKDVYTLLVHTDRITGESFLRHRTIYQDEASLELSILIFAF